MTGPGSGGDIVSAQTNALEGAQTAIVQLLSKARSMSQMGLVSRVTPVHTAMRNCTRDEDAMGQAARV